MNSLMLKVKSIDIKERAELIAEDSPLSQQVFISLNETTVSSLHGSLRPIASVQFS
jgi:hypothetical protein